MGKDIYPPVEIIILIFLFFKKIKDFKVAKISKTIFHGNKIILFVIDGTLIILMFLNLGLFINFLEIF